MDRMEAAHCAKLQGSWAERQGPIHRRLSVGIRGAIERGLPMQGTRLPSERALALALSLLR
jgi:DNA-binding transcriptional MocR family regulator